MGRYIQNTVMLAGVQAAIGTELTTMTGAANAILISEVNIDPYSATDIERNVLIGTFGATAMLQGEVVKKLSFTVELSGTGVTTGSGTAPAYDALMQMCALVGVGAATPVRWSYSLLSNTLKAATLYVYDDGVLHKYVDAMGDWEMVLGVDGLPKIKFTVTARDIGPAADTAAANPTATLTAFKQPVTITSVNAANGLQFGGTLTAGVVSGASMVPSTGIQSLKLGNSVQFTPLLGGNAVDIVNRKITGSIELQLTAAQEITYGGYVRNNTLQAMSLLIGTAVGAKALIWLPSTQLHNMKKIDKSGLRLIGFDFIALPVSGNDEAQIILQ